MERGTFCHFQNVVGILYERRRTIQADVLELLGMTQVVHEFCAHVVRC